MSEKKELTYEQAKDKALRLLEFRSHSEKELKIKLKRAGALDDDVEEIIEFCKNYNFINDESFAKRKAADLKNLKKYGKNRIKNELYSLGIDSEIIENAISELDFDDDVLLGLVEKKLSKNFEKKNIDKCIRYFLYRGYEFGEIKRCIENIKETEEITE